jgi:hypothetical protein
MQVWFSTGEQPAVKTVSTKLLSGTPARLSLALPGTNVILRHIGRGTLAALKHQLLQLLAAAPTVQ